MSQKSSQPSSLSSNSSRSSSNSSKSSSSSNPASSKSPEPSSSPFSAVDVIRRKRNGDLLSPEEIGEFIRRYSDDRLPDYQMSALAMAVYFQGLSEGELQAWTRAMLHSGETLDLTKIAGAKVDKHSTGGVGDKISIPLAPLVAACGVKVPMLSGRGLGHTGGTLDKLESIPGFRVMLETEEFCGLVERVGLALGGQTRSLVPADRKLYALRDVTATVESIPLIASSIMSKKLAEDIDGLVLDVKFGSGAFMREFERARELAQTMVHIGAGFGTQVVALLTSMDQPLGHRVGNALEIVESIEILQNRGPADVRELTLALGAEMLVMGKAASSLEAARETLEEALASGRALKKFEEIVEAQGGDPRSLSDFSRLPTARHLVEVKSPGSGFVSAIQTDEVGYAALILGAGRQQVDDLVNPAVGIDLKVKLGEQVEQGAPLALLHADDLDLANVAAARLSAAFQLSESAPKLGPLVAERVAN